MIPLNLPPFDHKLKKAEGKLWIFDVIRKKYIALIPEEWVRQHFIHYMLAARNYPRSLIRVEGGLQYNSLQKRSDIVVFDRQGKPWLVVECKSPEIRVGEQTLFQAATYNATLRAKYLVVTNGITHLYAATDWASGTTAWLPELPLFEDEI